MTIENEISIREFARRIHVSEGAVRKAIKEKKIVQGWDEKKGKILFGQAYAEYGQAKTAPKAGHGISKQKLAEKINAIQGMDVPAPGEYEGYEDDVTEFENLSYTDLLELITIHPSLPYNEALRRGEILSIAKEKMNLQKMQGTLVSKDEIDKQLYAIGNELKQSLQNIPNRVISLLRTAPNEVEAGNILLKEINQVLEQFTQAI